MGGSIVRRLVLLMMMMFIVHVPVVMQVDPTAPSLPPSSILPNLITLPHQNNINYIACTVEWNLICAIPKSRSVFRIQKGRIQALYSKGRRTILQETPFCPNKLHVLSCLVNCSKFTSKNIGPSIKFLDTYPLILHVVNASHIC